MPQDISDSAMPEPAADEETPLDADVAATEPRATDGAGEDDLVPAAAAGTAISPVAGTEVSPAATAAARDAPLFTFGPWLWGALGVVFAGILAATGVGLMFFFVPDPLAAGRSLVELREVSAFGFLRPLHYWAGQGLLVAAWLHLVRVFVAGSYRRKLGWRITVLLVGLVTLMAWTGVWLASPSSALAVPAVHVVHCLVLPLVAITLVLVWARFRGRPENPGDKSGAT